LALNFDSSDSLGVRVCCPIFRVKLLYDILDLDKMMEGYGRGIS